MGQRMHRMNRWVRSTPGSGLRSRVSGVNASCTTVHREVNWDTPCPISCPDFSWDPGIGTGNGTSNALHARPWSGAGRQGSGVRSQVSGIRGQVSGVRHQGSGCREFHRTRIARSDTGTHRVLWPVPISEPAPESVHIPKRLERSGLFDTARETPRWIN